MKKLEIGYNHTFEIRTENIQSELPEGFSILFISDLHLSCFSQKLIHKLICEIEVINPDIILLGGDYIDFDGGLIYLNSLLAYLSTKRYVFAIAGNHDYFFGISKVKSLFLENNIKWIENGYHIFSIKSINLLVSNLHEKVMSADFNIQMVHNPKDFERTQQHFHLQLAGHLHGCQIVWWKKDHGLYPGKLFYPWNLLKKEGLHNLKLISKGLGDTLPIRFNCPKDIILVNVLAKETK